MSQVNNSENVDNVDNNENVENVEDVEDVGIVESNENVGNVENRYEKLSQYHPSIKDLNGKYYWSLLPGLTKEILIKKAGENLELAKEHEDNEYIEFLEGYLRREGYEVDLEDTSRSLEESINKKPKIKLQITLKKPTSTPQTQGAHNEIRPNTHSKSKTKQHNQALQIQKYLSTKLEKCSIQDPNYLKAIEELGYRTLDQDKLIRVADLRRSIIIYVAMNDLQDGMGFRLDSRLKTVLGDRPECSYYELKAILARRLLQPSSQIVRTSDPGGSKDGGQVKTKINVTTINRIAVKKTIKNFG